MISASEINDKVCKERQRQEEDLHAEQMAEARRQKNKRNRIKLELLEVEKAIDTFSRKIDIPNIALVKYNYIKVDIVLSMDVIKILRTEGYFIDNLYTNETRLYFDKDMFEEIMAQHDLNIPKNGFGEYGQRVEFLKLYDKAEKADELSNLSGEEKVKSLKNEIEYCKKWQEEINQERKESHNLYDESVLKDIIKEKEEADFKNSTEVFQTILDSYCRINNMSERCITIDLKGCDIQKIREEFAKAKCTLKPKKYK